MIQIHAAVDHVLRQLDELLQLLPEGDFISPCRQLSDSSIGQHVRHIIEMFQCLEQGYSKGQVNYENRPRDRRIETQKDFALDQLGQLLTRPHHPPRELSLEGTYHESSGQHFRVPTTYYRELVYNLDHAVHHMAMIKIGLKEKGSVEIPPHFGVAASTIRNQQVCAR